jgi:hypothetical protein
MGDFGRVDGVSAGQTRLYSSEELDGPNASLATDAGRSSAPATTNVGTGAETEGTLERAEVGSLTPRSGESYEQCVNRYKAESMTKYQAVGFVAGCATGGVAGGLGGVEAGLPGVILGAAFGCASFGAAGAIAATASGASAGEVQGKVACDGRPGSPEATKSQPPAAQNSSSRVP